MSSDALVRVAGLQELLDRCQRLIRINAFFRGLAETVCVLIAGVVFSGLLDYLISLPGVVRFVFLASTVLVTGVVAWKRLLRPVLIKAPDEELGAAVDLQFPELQESLATLISIQEPSVTVGEAGSSLMRQRLQKHVQTQLRSVQPSAVVQSGKTLKRCGLAITSVIAILIPLMLWPSGSRLLMQRLLMPFANLAAPSNLFFEVPDGSRVIATNSDAVFIAIPQWRTGVAGELPANVVVEMRRATGDSEDFPMAYDASDSFYSITLNGVRDSFQYRIRGDGAASEWFELTVADPPRILSAVLQETPPVYTGRPVETYDGIVGDIHVFERSRIEINLSFNKPVKSVRMEWSSWQPIDMAAASPDKGDIVVDDPDNEMLLPEEIAAANLAPVRSDVPEPPASPGVLSADGLTAAFQFDALGGGQFEFVVEDSLGLTNTAETTRRLIVTTDTPPQLTVTGISDGLDVRPDDNVPLNCAVVDDLGVGVLEIHFQKNADATRIQPAEPFDRGAVSVSHEFRLDLKTIDVKAGDTVTFRVRATDERPIPEPQVVWKGPWTIRIADDAEPLGQKPLREADQQLIDSLRKVEEELLRAAQKANEIRNEIGQQWDKDAQESVQDLSEKQQTQGRQLQQLAEKVAEHPLMQKQAAQLTELAQQIRQDVPSELDEAAAADRDSAKQKLQDAMNELNEVREDLHKATNEIEKLAQLEQELAELNRLALEAQQLAQDSEKLQQDREQNQPEPGQTEQDFQQQLDQKQQQLQQEQQELTNDLGDLLQRKKELLQAAREAQLEQAAAVAEQAKKLAEQQQQLAEGVNEEARDTARDAQELANELQKSRNDAEQLANQIQQQAQDVAKPEVQPLDEAIRDLRQGNLASPQEGIDKAQQQLTDAAKQLDKPVEAKPVDANAPASDENARKDEERKLAEQNENRKELGTRAEQINERLEQLEGQLAEMAAELGAKPKQQPDDSRKNDPGEAAASAEAPGDKNNPSGESKSEAGQPPENANGEPADLGDADKNSKPAAQADGKENSANESPKVGRSLLDQLDRLRESAHQQADAVNADASAGNEAKNHAQQAAQKADDAMRHASAGQFNRAAERMRNAASESSNASGDLNGETQQDRKAQMQQQSDSFSRMADTVQQMQQDNAAQVATQQDSQREVAEAADGLPQALNELSERLNIPALGMQHLARPAQEAATAAQEGAMSGSQAADQLDQAQMQQAGQTAQEAAGQLNRAAQLAQQAAQGQRDPNAVIPSEVGESVNDALHSLQKASQMMNEEAARQEAERQSQQAGQQGPDGQPGQPGEQGQSGEPGQGSEPGQPGDQTGQQPGQGEPGQGQPGEGQPGQGQPGEGQAGQGEPGGCQPGQGKGQSAKSRPGQGQPGESQGSSAEQLANAARALQSAAKRALPNQFSPGQLNSEGSTASSDPRSQGNPAQFDGQSPDATGRKGKGRMWGQLQDELGGDIGDAGKEVLDNEYSELIRRYRRDLARSGNKDAARKPDPKK